MTENAPPQSATAPATDSSRGMPYYEKLRKDLRDALNRKRQLDQQMAQIEDQIYRTESTYLDETSSAGGNIIRGFDAYIKSTSSTSTAPLSSSTRRKVGAPADSDRIFSRSSACVSRDSPAPTSGSASGTGTPNGLGTPLGGVGMRRKVEGEEERGGMIKRGKISYGRD